MEMSPKLLDRIQGLPVFQSPHAVTTEGKQHKKKPWDRHGSYHRRMVKKWARRYGPVKITPAMYTTPDGLFVHPSLMSALREKGILA